MNPAADNIPVKIGIVGLGPIGMTLAVHLKEAGCDVLVCENDRIRASSIRNEGITLTNVMEKSARFESVYTSVRELMEHHPAYVFLCLKSYQAGSVIMEAAAWKDTVFVSAQNGIDVESGIVEAAGENRTLRMIINFAGNTSGPASVKITFFNPPNYLAALDDGSSHHAKFLASLLNEAGLVTEQVNSFELTKYAWEKTILNAALSPICGIGKFTMAEAMAFPDTIELIEQIILEAVEVANAEKIFYPDEFVRNCLRYLRKGGNHFPSLAVDLINNRPTEIDVMNGKIVEYGRKHYIRTPLNLSMVNMVKAMTQRNMVSQGSSSGSAAGVKTRLTLTPLRARPEGPCYLGIDLGSAYTKFTVIDDHRNIVYRHILKTLNRDKVAAKHVIEAIKSEFGVSYSCATGYGRKHFPDSDIVKTEINCAAAGAALVLGGSKNIVDIGGEDIKVIHCDGEGKVLNFYLNDKCAAGTGAFLTEIAERAGMEIAEMSRLAAQSDYSQELNSFCAVFAKTEIMNWIFDGQPLQNLARGIYLSIANRIAKMRIDPSLPVVMAGGVIAYHPYIGRLLGERLRREVTVLDEPQHIVSLGAALMARDHASAQSRISTKVTAEL